MGVTLMKQSQHKPKTKPFYLLSRLGRHIQVVPGKEKKKMDLRAEIPVRITPIQSGIRGMARSGRTKRNNLETNSH